MGNNAWHEHCILRDDVRQGTLELAEFAADLYAVRTGAAWHTLDDGGNPDDPRLQPLLEKIAKEETDPKLRQRALDLIAATRKVEEQKEALLAQKTHTFSGRCDWCGTSNVSVSYDYETEFETHGTKRFALVCETCEKN